ncbi:MAG: hypothetical protein R6U37_09935 [Dehalococcoidia bacterium]
MKRRIEFEIGQQYTNRKGIYEVLDVDGDAMHIRWDSGEESATSVTMQSRILTNMERELDYPGLNLSESPPKNSKTTHSYRI